MQRIEKLIVVAFFSLNLFQWISIIEIDFGIPSPVKYLLSVFVLGVLIYSRISNPQKEIQGKVFYLIVIIFTCWSLYLLIATGIKFRDTFYIQRALGQRYFFLPYLLPLLLLFTKYDLDFFSYYFKIGYQLIVVAIILQFSILLLGLSVENWYEQTHRIKIFDIGSGFLLLTAHIVRKRQVANLVMLYFVLNIIIFSLLGRRGPVVEYFIFLAFMIILRLQSPFLDVENRKMIYFYVSVFIFLLIFSFGQLQSVYIFQRGFDRESLEASRGDVFEDFFIDFSSRHDWIFGRGLDGTILRTISEEGFESLIENGYLTIILKGGFLYLVPMMCLMLWAVILGFFLSRNDLIKAFAALIFIQIFSMLSFGLPDYSVQYILIWIAVSACFSSDLRKISNEDLYNSMNYYFN